MDAVCRGSAHVVDRRGIACDQLGQLTCIRQAPPHEPRLGPADPYATRTSSASRSIARHRDTTGDHHRVSAARPS
jgi:hypothetical protein